MCQHPTEEIIATGDQKGNINVWNINSLSTLNSFNIHDMCKDRQSLAKKMPNTKHSTGLLPQPLVMKFSPNGADLAILVLHGDNHY